MFHEHDRCQPMHVQHAYTQMRLLSSIQVYHILVTVVLHLLPHVAIMIPVSVLIVDSLKHCVGRILISPQHVQQQLSVYSHRPPASCVD